MLSYSLISFGSFRQQTFFCEKFTCVESDDKLIFITRGNPYLMDSQGYTFSLSSPFQSLASLKETDDVFASRVKC